MPTWRSGRVLLTGDAACCVTPRGGGGASLALVDEVLLPAPLRPLAARLTQVATSARPLPATSRIT